MLDVYLINLDNLRLLNNLIIKLLGFNTINNINSQKI